MKQILLCDDDSTIHEIMRAASEGLPVTITGTTTVADCLEIARTGTLFDYIFLDGQLEKGDTLRFCHDLGEGMFPHLKDSTVVLISNNEDIVEVQRIAMEDAVKRVIEIRKPMLVSEFRKLFS